MVDFSELTDKQLRELLMKYEDNPPPVNANTRSAVEKQLRRYYTEDVAVNTSFVDVEKEKSISFSEKNSESTSPTTPMTVRFDTKPDSKYEYDRMYTPSYCRKSLNEYRDKSFDYPAFNLLDKPGFTPHSKKQLTKKIEKPAPSSSIMRKLFIVIILCVAVVGVYFLIDQNFGIPFQSSEL